MPVVVFRAALLAGLAAIPPLALLGLPATSIVFTVNAVAALLVLAPGLRAWASAPSWPPTIMLALLAIPALGLISALWSIMPGESATRAMKLLAIAGGGIAVAMAARGPAGPRPAQALIAVLLGMAVAAGLALTDHVLLFELIDDLEPGFTPRRGFYSRGATVMILFAWLAVIGLLRLDRRGIAALLYLGVGALVLVKFRSGAAAMVWATAACVYTGCVLGGPRVRQALGLLLAATVLVAPLWAALLPAPDALHADRRALPSSWSHRIVIWQFAAQRIFERPVLGWGLDASRSIPGGRVAIPWQMDPDPNDRGDRVSVVQLMPLHPHSIALQLWLELGLLGAGALATLAYLLARRAGDDAGLAALVFAGAAICHVSYGAWQTWWLSTLFMVAGAALLLARRKEPT